MTILGVTRPFAPKLFDEGARKRVLDELAAEGQRLNLAY